MKTLNLAKRNKGLNSQQLMFIPEREMVSESILTKCTLQATL